MIVRKPVQILLIFVFYELNAFSDPAALVCCDKAYSSFTCFEKRFFGSW